MNDRQPASDGGAAPVVEIDDVSVCYRLAKQRLASFKEYAIHWMRGALQHEDLWAVNEVSLQVAPGERFGIIGRNGAGKSTLLKVVSGVLEPTSGSVRMKGRVAPILELGTGFDPELTGIENIFLNALLLGRTRREIAEKLEEIVTFSGIKEFIRSPTRNYSSGMFARLGFSIATAWPIDLLILDEVLAVGDARFVQKCQKRLAELHEMGTAVLFVTHSLADASSFCDRVLWLEQGRVRKIGPAAEIVAEYAAAESG